MRILLSPDAEADLEDIRVFSEMQWGEPRSLAYRDSLNQTISRLADHPEIRIAFPDAEGRDRIIRHQSHNVIYRQSELGDIRILRVMHFRRRISREVLAELE